VNRPGAYLQAMAGHLVDLYRLALFNVSNPHSYSKFRTIKHVARRTDARAFVEAGTYRGVTAARCARIFDQVFTVELDEKLAAAAAKYLDRWPNVTAIRGDALVEVPAILARPEVNNVIVFLDGHFSSGETAMGDLAEPAVEEIRLLGKYRQKIRGLIIDDFRGFGRWEGFPAKSELFAALEKEFPEFDITVHLDQVIVTPDNSRHASQ